MKIKILFPNVIFFFFLSSCGIFNQSQSELASGTYKSKINGKSAQIVYVENINDTLKVYVKNDATSKFSKSEFTSYEKNPKQKPNDGFSFYKNSLDVDFITIPFKYRPSQKSLPNQFTTNLNGAVYMGRRKDMYKINYTRDPLNKDHRNEKHYGFSFGFFTGFGATAINSWVSEDKIAQEYDGLVWSKGVAGIIGINNFTIGLAVGFDDLLDKNKNVWIYQQKLWYGLAFGLNLN